MSIHYIEDTELQKIVEAIKEKNKMVEGETFSGADIPDLIRNVGKPYIDTSEITDFSYFCGYNRFNDNLDKISVSSKATTFTRMFQYSDTLEQVPLFDTGNATNMQDMFYECISLKSIPAFDTSKNTNFSSFAYHCLGLTEIPSLNTSNGKNFDCAFATSTNIKKIGELDLSKAENINYLFRKCYSLSTLEGLTFDSMPTSKMTYNPFDNCSRLANITIKGTIKVDSNHLKLSHCSYLTVDSMLSILNSLEDNTGEAAQYTVYFGSTNLAKLTDEQKAIAANKNINLA